MTQHQPDMNRRQWCASLAKLVSPAFPADAAKALVDMLPALRHLPEVLFTADTLGHVAMAKRRQSVPAFDEIVTALNDYRRTFVHERPLALPSAVPVGRAPPGEGEVRHVRGAIEGLMADLDAARIKREAMEPPGPVLRPLADVTAKGDELIRIRGQALAPRPAVTTARA